MITFKDMIKVKNGHRLKVMKDVWPLNQQTITAYLSRSFTVLRRCRNPPPGIKEPLITDKETRLSSFCCFESLTARKREDISDGILMINHKYLMCVCSVCECVRRVPLPNSVRLFVKILNHHHHHILKGKVDEGFMLSMGHVVFLPVQTGCLSVGGIPGEAGLRRA